MFSVAGCIVTSRCDLTSTLLPCLLNGSTFPNRGVRNKWCFFYEWQFLRSLSSDVRNTFDVFFPLYHHHLFILFCVLHLVTFIILILCCRILSFFFFFNHFINPFEDELLPVFSNRNFRLSYHKISAIELYYTNISIWKCLCSKIKNCMQTPVGKKVELFKFLYFLKEVLLYYLIFFKPPVCY